MAAERIENLQDSFVNRLAYNDDQKAALTFAFYNTLLFTLLAIALASIFAVYQLLYMFLVPILWASLIGTVLFPLKRMISANLKAWLDQLDQLDRPLLVGVALLPIQTVLGLSNHIYTTMLSFTGICIACGYCTLKFFCYYDAFTTLLNWVSRLYATVDSLIGFFTLKWVFALILLYTLGFCAWIYLQQLAQINKKLARVVSLPIWFFLLARLSDFFGPFRVVAFASSCILLALISAGIIDPESNGNNEEEGKQPGGAIEKEKPKKSESDMRTAVEVESRLDQALSSDSHLRIICALCALLFVVNHDTLLLIILFLLILAFLVDIGDRLGATDILWNFLLSAQQQVANGTAATKFVRVILAGPLRKFIRLLFTSDRMFITGLSARVDLISSVCVMAALAVGSLFFFLFTAFQLHGETVHLVKLGGNVLSSNPDWLRYAMNYTEGHLGEHDLDNYMEQAYQQGRSWLASNIRSLADPKDPARADQLEEQAKLLVDNLYRLWEERGQRIFEEQPLASQFLQNVDDDEDGTMLVKGRGNGQWLSKLVANANLGLWKRELTALVQENLEMVWTIAHSLWHILLMNINLLTTVLVALLGLLLGFGFELLNFLIECIVFLTTVYYLLANSADRWLPLHWVNDFSRSLQIHRLTSENGGHRVDVAKAVEGAISGVFLLSAKMAIFYGMYTHFVHSLFTLNVIFIPSMLAACFAAIPIIPPYAVALFGIVELWLVRAEPVAAVVFACASVAPLFFADPTFYREVKGTHPYVTGLAVVGGIYWLGLQGAIIGPIMLCLMIALLNVYAEFANHRPSTSIRL